MKKRITILSCVVIVILALTMGFVLKKDKLYNITFDSNGGDGVQNVSLYEGEVIDFAKPKKAGYVFLGWYLDKQLRNKATFSFMPNNDLVLYAKWKEAVVYHDNGDSYSIIGIADKNIYEIEIPELYNDKPITAIDDYAFTDCGELVRIVLPDSITSIGKNAFDNCFKLVEICNNSKLNITKGSNDFGNIGLFAKNIYSDINGKSNVVVNQNNFVIYSDNTEKIIISYLDDFTSIQIPHNITGIGQYAFANRYNVEEIFIPSSVKYIGDYAFADCVSMLRCTISNNVQYLGEGAFYKCSSLINVNIGNGVQAINKFTFYDCGSLSNVALGKNIKTIDEKAFFSCANLVKIDIPYNVNEIGNSAFFACSNIAEILLPDSLRSIGNYAFANCSKLNDISIPNSLIDIGSDVFNNCQNLKFHEYANALYLGNILNPHLILVKAVNENISTCNINNKTKFIYNYAFADCNSLSNIRIPSNVEYIGKFAFLNCLHITSMNLPSSVKNIGASAFGNCSDLSSISIPNSIINIGDNAFLGCNNLHFYSFDNALYLGNSLNQFLILMSAKNTDITNCVVHQNTKFIYDNAFSDCTKLNSVNLPNNIVNIGGWAFSNCTSLNSISIPKNVKYMGDSVFDGCIALKISCNLSNKPDSWSDNWNKLNYYGSDFVPVTWSVDM